MASSSSSPNAIQQLIVSTSNSTESYLILLQHSLSYAQRQAVVSETSDQDVYRRARVRTPAANATRDSMGILWLMHLAVELEKPKGKLIWVSTTNSLSTPSSFVTVDIASNPVGWDCDIGSEEDESSSLSLNDFESISSAIENCSRAAHVGPLPVVIESIAPLVMRHGLSQTLLWLRRIQSSSNISQIVVPVLTEVLTPPEHRKLEDMAQAIFYMQEGEITMVRQGVRDSGNTVRKNIPYRLETNEIGAVSLVLEEDDNAIPEEETHGETHDQVPSPQDEKVPPTLGRSGKVTLQHEDESSNYGRVAKAEPPPNRPQIYIQDDDPEFDDLDEEDPDDDLDI